MRHTVSTILSTILSTIKSLIGHSEPPPPQFTARNIEDLVLSIVDHQFGVIPEDFPKDVPLFPNLRGVTYHGTGWFETISGSSELSPAEIITQYESKFLEAGWSIVDPGEDATEYMRAFTKDTRKVHVAALESVILRSSVWISVEDESKAPKFEPDEPEARAVFDAMADVYRNCDYYQDTGEIREDFSSFNTLTRFKTAFKRPGQFRYETIEDGDRTIVHSDGEMSQISSYRDGIQPESSLDLALAGEDSHLASMLLPEEINSHFANKLTNELKLLEEVSLNGRPCFRVGAKNNLGGPITCWIDKETYLLLRIQESYDSKMHTTSSRVTTITNYNPKLNTHIPAADLSFAPEGQIKEPIHEIVRRQVKRCLR